MPRILLVEDNPGDARLLRELLSEEKRLQTDLVTVDRLVAAREALAVGRFEVVLLDLSLPDAKGIEALIGLHEYSPQTPIVVLTGLADEDAATQAVQRGAQDYLVKGQVDGPGLARAIRYAIGRSNADAMERQLFVEQRAREQAEVAEKRFRVLAEAIPQIVWELTPEGDCSYISPRWFDFTGLPPGAPVDINARIHPADLIRAVESWAEALRAQAVWQLEYRLLRKDGAWRWHLARSVPQPGSDGKIAKWIGTATDIDDHKRVEEERGRLYDQARQAIKSRDDLLATVSHDLRSPLSSIVMSASLLAPAQPGAPLDPARVAKYAGMIGKAARRMDHLIRDLLDIASIESGHLSLSPARVPVAALISDALDAMGPVAQEKKQRLEAQVESGDTVVHCDRGRVLQVFSNLLGNAIKFSPEESAIVIRAHRAGEQVELSVGDRGPGIDGAQLRHVFDRFWQAKETAKAGTGLGLAISRGIVEQHRGKIWVESRAGEGTVFTFTLPVDASL